MCRQNHCLWETKAKELASRDAFPIELAEIKYHLSPSQTVTIYIRRMLCTYIIHACLAKCRKLNFCTNYSLLEAGTGTTVKRSSVVGRGRQRQQSIGYKKLSRCTGHGSCRPTQSFDDP